MADDLTTALAHAIARLPRGGEVRDGQVQMAIDVADAIEHRHHLVVQAGTGTGKSLAYLVPSIMSGSKVVVSTATKALQDQLAGKDLPFLQKAMPDPFTFAMLKGRSNYLCVQRAREVSGGDGQLTLDEVDTVGNLGREILRLVEWGRTAESGDRADAPFEPSPRAWQAVSVSGMECPGANKCPSGDECFAEKARAAAETADVVVVNTHLYGAHLASGGHVLPEHDVVIFDEAHELEDIVASALGVEMSAGRFSSLVRLARRHVGPDGGEALDDVFTAGDALERALAPWANKRLPSSGPEEITEALTTAATRVQTLLRAIKGSPDDPARARAQQAGGHLQGDLDLLRDPGAGRVRWVEGPAHAPLLKLASVDVAGALAEKVWPEVTAVLTSATIPVGLPVRIGLPPEKHEMRDVGSPFDFGEQALLYCATHMPEPRAAGYEDALHDELTFLIGAAGGRTLALFTSWRSMQGAAEAVARRVDVPILAQGELPKPKLVERFAAEEAACLFATMGFWQGVDVPGRTLSVVTIDRLPFPRPDEPLQQARREQAGAAAFRVIDLPRAATMLAQGAGRLIRTSEDRGVVAVLDSRLATANYRWDLIRALPPMRRTKDRDDVAAFLKQ
ncbi:MAG TPA: ATP-dependent DNA helicase [Acidimicrobiales bacterium]|nr:ATP-dependent DNA helicase [Acidimicrobiales bacterium]